MSDRLDGVREWSAAPGLIVVAWVGTAVSAAWLAGIVLTGADPAGLLIAAVAAAGFGVTATFLSRARPRLRADPDGLTVGGLLRSRHHPWPLVQEVRVVTTRRWGRQSALLEVDTVGADGSERLLVFTRLDLAAEPADVAPQVRALRPS